MREDEEDEDEEEEEEHRGSISSRDQSEPGMVRQRAPLRETTRHGEPISRLFNDAGILSTGGGGALKLDLVHLDDSGVLGCL